MQYENHWSTRLRKEIKVNPELQDFHSWLVDKGKGAYMRFLVTHPEPLLQDPLRNFVTMMSANVEMYTPAGFKPALGKPLGEVVFPKIWVWLLAWAAPLLIGLLVPSLVRGRDHNLLIPFVMLTLVFPQAVISYNGDSMGLTRHPLLAAIELRLAVWLVITYYADKLMTLILEKWVSIHLFFSIGRNRMYLVSVLGICLVMASVILEYVHGDGARVIGWRQWTVGVTGLILVAYGIALGVKNRKRG
jgi:hypothetical protein